MKAAFNRPMSWCTCIVSFCACWSIVDLACVYGKQSQQILERLPTSMRQVCPMKSPNRNCLAMPREYNLYQALYPMPALKGLKINYSHAYTRSGAYVQGRLFRAGMLMSRLCIALVRGTRIATRAPQLCRCLIQLCTRCWRASWTSNCLQRFAWPWLCPTTRSIVLRIAPWPPKQPLLGAGLFPSCLKFACI